MTIIAGYERDIRSVDYNPYAGNCFGRQNGNHYPVVRVVVNTDKLTGLAKFLVDNVSHTINHRGSLVVTCYNGASEADLLRVEKRANVDGVIRMYDLENKAAYIQDYLFPKIEPLESPEDYFNKTAEDMISAGVEMVKIRYAGWGEGRVYFV